MPRTSPACTVVIPCFNGEEVLEGAFESVMAQRFREFHLVMVDDGSTDGTRRLAERLAAGLPNVSVIALPENRGRCHARNRGARERRTEFVSFLDQDDGYDPEFLAVTIDLLRQQPGIDGVRVLPRVAVAMHPIQYESISGSLANTIVMRRYAFEFVGGWPDRPLFRELTVGAEDIALRNLFMMVFYEALVHRPLYHFSHRPGNALDEFLARTEVVDGELVFRAGHEDNRRIRAELKALRLAFARRLRDFIQQNAAAIEPITGAQKNDPMR